eukprot:3953126-Pleurochrysis_carterae.AAC.1
MISPPSRARRALAWPPRSGAARSTTRGASDRLMGIPCSDACGRLAAPAPRRVSIRMPTG